MRESGDYGSFLSLTLFCCLADPLPRAEVRLCPFTRFSPRLGAHSRSSPTHSLYWHFPSDALAALTTRHSKLTASVTSLRSSLASESELVSAEEGVREGGVSFDPSEEGREGKLITEERKGGEGAETVEVGDGEGEAEGAEGGGGEVREL